MSVQWGTRSTETYVSWSGRFTGSVQADFTVRYDLDTTGLWATIEINGAIGLYAEREFGSQYNILSSVYQSFDVFYQVEGGTPPAGSIYQDFAVVYAISSDIHLSEVEQDFTVFWQADGVVVSDFTTNYDINQDTSFPTWTEETVETGSWADVALAAKTWATATQPTTTWN